METSRDDIKLCVSDSRDCWKMIWTEKDAFEIKLKETILSKEVFFDVLMNGWLAHSNQKLSDLYHEIPVFAKMSLFTSFQNALTRLYMCLHNIDVAAEVILDKPDKILKIQLG